MRDTLTQLEEGFRRPLCPSTVLERFIRSVQAFAHEGKLRPGLADCVIFLPNAVGNAIYHIAEGLFESGQEILDFRGESGFVRGDRVPSFSVDSLFHLK